MLFVGDTITRVGVVVTTTLRCQMVGVNIVGLGPDVSFTILKLRQNGVGKIFNGQPLYNLDNLQHENNFVFHQFGVVGVGPCVGADTGGGGCNGGGRGHSHLIFVILFFANVVLVFQCLVVVCVFFVRGVATSVIGHGFLRNVLSFTTRDGGAYYPKRANFWGSLLGVVRHLSSLRRRWLRYLHLLPRQVLLQLGPRLY